MTKSGRATKDSTVEKETLAFILALQHCEVYVTSGQFSVEVFTDHKSLTMLTFLSRIKKNQRLTRWNLFLQECNLGVKHIPGKQNLVADTLSHC